jgi:hypothetical protein
MPVTLILIKGVLMFRLPAKMAFRMPGRACMVLFIVTGIICLARSLPAIDVFDRHDSTILKQIVEAGAAQTELTQPQVAKLKPLTRDLEGTCLVVETNGGNLAKVLVSWGFRKQREAEKPTPVLMLDRYVTYEQGRGDSSLANGSNVMIFPGFKFDFDLGQIVPEGFDADIEFTDKGAIRCLDIVKLHTVDGSQLPAAEDPAPAKKKTDLISPEDFSGVWNVDGDGRFIGEWELTVNEQGNVTGKFLSAETKSSYPILGQMGGLPHQIKLQVQFNNAVQVVEAYLWTKDKSKLAGSFSLAGRKFGISATRQVAK